MLGLHNDAGVMGRGHHCRRRSSSIYALETLGEIADDSLMLLLLLLLLLVGHGIVILLVLLLLLLRMQSLLLLLLLQVLLLHQMLLLLLLLMLLLLLRAVVGKVAQLEIVTQIAVSRLRGRCTIHNRGIAGGQLALTFRTAGTAIRIGRKGTNHRGGHIHRGIVVIIIMIVIIVVQIAGGGVRILHFRGVNAGGRGRGTGATSRT